MKSTKPLHLEQGFALVVTLTLMVLLSILALGLLSLSSVSLRTMGQNSSLSVARSNARMAMLIAIGQLQMHAGPDQRVTANAELIDDSSPNPQWTGSWKTGGGNEKSEPVWLVSGNTPDPATQLNEDNSALLSSTPDSDPTRKELRAALVELKDDTYNSKYAYWIGDEGTRARVDIEEPETTASNNTERTARSLSPEKPRFDHFDEHNSAAWTSFDSVNKQTLATMDTLGLALGAGTDFTQKELAHHYFNDLTTGGFGLPVNVRDGGMKTDLSLVFDTSIESNNALISKAIGATPTASYGSYDFTGNVTNPDLFFLDHLIPNSVNGGYTGPNWGTLWDYSKSWKKVSSSNTSTYTKALPRLQTDLRQANWKPYVHSNGQLNDDNWKKDTQQTNSPMHPVISMAQISFRLRAIVGGVGTTENPPVGKYYIPQLVIQPVIGIWNPHNVTINSTRYLINWAIPPYLRFAHQKDNGYMDVQEIWLREYWNPNADGTLPTVSLPTENSQGGGYFNLLTPNISIAPGEIKYFCIKNPAPLAASLGSNALTQDWSEKGGFYVNIRRSSNHPTYTNQTRNTDVRVPEGSKIWFGSILLQDTHNDGVTKEWGVGTASYFKTTTNKTISSNAATTWLTLKAASGSDHLQRFTNIWNGGSNSTMSPDGTKLVPEHTRHSGAKPAGAAVTYIIDTLDAGLPSGGDLAHLASWRFTARTTTQGQKAFESGTANQGIRGVMDTNPRAMAINPNFDGSKVVAGGFEGWTMISNFIGGQYDGNGSDIGDKQGGARGLIAEGKVGFIEPEASSNFTGYGGPSNTSSEGVSKVILYDVPRAPLVSVGQFQHAGLGRYQNEPAYIIGNSYADIRIPLGAAKVDNFAGTGALLTDISYETNKSVWDSAFFSTVGPDYVGNSGQSYDKGLSFADLSSGKRQLPNPRMVFTPLAKDTSFSDIFDDAGDLAPRALASRILIKGAFNVNSTSKEAWKAILSTMGGSEMPYINLTNNSTTWSKPEGIRFNRFSYTGSEKPYEDSSGDDSAFWLGWRKLSDKQLDQLAEEIVNEVKLRGPFRSMADFVNRNPNPDLGGTGDEKLQQQRKGALQAALDRIANSEIPQSLGANVIKPNGSQFPTDVVGTDKQSAGYPGYILQGDVLQSLGPILQVRSDYFRIRAYGEASDKNGNITKAWCEAYVQRYPDYVDSTDKPETPFATLTKDANKEFGRNFRLVSFRWLSPTEI